MAAKAKRKNSGDTRRKTPPAVLPTKRPKIAILGTTPSRMSAPIDDPEWTIWTIGPGGKDAHRWDALFEIHGTWPADFQGYLNDLSKVKPPQQVFTMRPMQEALTSWAVEHKLDLSKAIEGDCSAALTYPRKAILQKYLREMWFSSSISWLIALAIEQKPSHIGLFGIDLESGEEYISQFLGCAHLMDYARMIGIDLVLPKSCGLLRDFRCYPDSYETLLALTLEEKKKFLDQKLAEMKGEHEAVTQDIQFKLGQLSALQAHDKLTPKQVAKEMKTLEELVAEGRVKEKAIASMVNGAQGEHNMADFIYSRFVVGHNDPDHVDANG